MELYYKMVCLGSYTEDPGGLCSGTLGLMELHDASEWRVRQQCMHRGPQVSFAAGLFLVQRQSVSQRQVRHSTAWQGSPTRCCTLSTVMALHTTTDLTRLYVLLRLPCRSVVAHVRAKYPNNLLLAAGWSLGANILTRYLGEEGEGTPISAAAALCNPFNLVGAVPAGLNFSNDSSKPVQWLQVFTSPLPTVPCSPWPTAMSKRGSITAPLPCTAAHGPTFQKG